MPDREQRAHRGRDLGHRLDDPDERVGRDHGEGRHVLAEEVDLGGGELAPVLAVAGRPLEQRVVDVGDVLHVVDPVAGVAQGAADEVEGDVRRGVAEVGRVVGRDAADVQPGDLARRRAGARSGSACRTERSGSPWPGTAGTKGAGHDFTGSLYGAPVTGPATGSRASPAAAAGGSACAAAPSARDAQGTHLGRREERRAARRRAGRRGRRAGSRRGPGRPPAAARPAQPQSTVRSFGATPRLTPWSQPRTRSPSRMRWPPLRSELLMTASSTATVRSAGSGLWRHDDRCAGRGLALDDDHPAVGDVGRRRDVDQRVAARPRAGRPTAGPSPWPSGPSRSTVGGTTSKPPAALTR